jgi:predicted amidophosphoribosyltransferase
MIRILILGIAITITVVVYVIVLLFKKLFLKEEALDGIACKYCGFKDLQRIGKFCPRCGRLLKEENNEFY